MKKIIIIGAGISGLATAALLAKKGFEVEIYEKNKEIGGRARQLKEKGFSFDMGPSWYMMPKVFEDFYKEFGYKVSDFYELKKLDIHYKILFSEKEKYDIYSDFKRTKKVFESIEKNNNKINKFFSKTEDLYKRSVQGLILEDYKSWRKLLSKEKILFLPKMKLFTSFHNFIKKYFKNEKTQKILEFITVFLGGSPYNTPAFYSLLNYADLGIGLYHPIGGIHKIVEALEKICLDQGVKIYTDSPVQKINIENNKVNSILVNNKEIKTDFVVSNADYNFTETKLLEKKYQTYKNKYWQKKVISPSAFLVYLGVNKKLKSLVHHNLYLNPDWDEHFDDIFKRKIWPKNPSYYVHVPSYTDKTLAPENAEALILLVPIAPGLEDNEKIREKFYNKVINHLEKISGEKILDNIVYKKIFTIKDFEKDYNSYKGTAFGLAHTLRQSAIFRPRNYNRKIKNLFYTGQYTNPGIGVPTVILSARITANLINKK